MVEKINGGNIEALENDNASIIENPYKASRAENDIELKQDMAEVQLNAEEILKDSPTNLNLSEPTKEKVGLMSRIMAKLSGGTNEEKNTKALTEIMAHPTANMAYEQAVEKGRGELYVEAFRKYGLPLYWREDEQRYGGQPFSSN